MCNPMAISAIAQGAQSIAGGAAAYQQLQATRAAALVNEGRARTAAADALHRGENEVGIARLKAGQLEGHQVAAAGSSGFAVDSGSFVDLIAGSREVSEYDALAARNNAAREAWGYELQAEDYKEQAAQANRDKNWALASALIGGGAQAGTAAASFKTSSSSGSTSASDELLDPYGDRPKLGRS